MASTLAANATVQYDAWDNRTLVAWSDAALVAWAIQHPGRQAQVVSVLVARYQSWIVQRCRFRLDNEQDALDVAEQVAMRLLKSLSQLRDPAGFKAWLCRIVDNCGNNFSVQRVRYVTNVDDERFIVMEERAAPSILKAMEDSEAVAHVLSKMSTMACEVLRLRFFDEYSLAQIAHHLCLKLSAAKARLYRALAQFKVLYRQLFTVEF